MLILIKLFTTNFQSYMEDHLNNKDRLNKEWEVSSIVFCFIQLSWVPDLFIPPPRPFKVQGLKEFTDFGEV